MTKLIGPQGTALRRRGVLALGAAALAGLDGAARAQPAWPARPVRVVVPYPPGGGTDTMARIAAQHLTQRLGQPFVVDNRAGANGQVGAEYVAQSTPDGYTLLFCGNTQTAVIPHLQPVGYDPMRDFAPVSIFGMNPAVFALHPAVPARNLEEFVALVRARPGELNYGSAGTGTITQLAAALWVHRMGLDIVHVPMRGGAHSVTEALAGRVQMLTGVTGDLLPAAANGGLRIIAVSGMERLPQLPEVPALMESVPGLIIINWNGFLAPSGTPVAVINHLASEIAEIVRLPEVEQRLEALGISPVGNAPASMRSIMRREEPLLYAATQALGARDR
jgi:tripartite-type tricarboxylate transporter receptor subunit TctC